MMLGRGGRSAPGNRDGNTGVASAAAVIATSVARSCGKDRRRDGQQRYKGEFGGFNMTAFLLSCVSVVRETTVGFANWAERAWAISG
jgi:hypothetical protein